MKLIHEFEELPEDRRPQDPHMDGSRLRFETFEYGGEFPDTTPQAIRLTDAEGRSCLYVPVKVAGRIVDSTKFTLRRRVLRLITPPKEKREARRDGPSSF